MCFVQKILKNFHESNIFQVSEIFPWGFCVYFSTAAFDTDIFQCAIFHQKEDHLIFYLVIMDESKKENMFNEHNTLHCFNLKNSTWIRQIRL